MGLGTVIAGIFGGRVTPSLGAITYTPATVAGGAAAGASAGSLASTLSGSVSYAVLSGALAVNASTGVLTTTGTAPSSGFISARVIADNGASIVGATINVPISPSMNVLAGLLTDVALSTPLKALSLASFASTSGQQGSKEVLIDTSSQAQTWLGGGVAITESSAYLLQTKLTAAQRQAFLTEVFNPTNGCNMVRLCMGDSDYAGQRSSGLTGNTTSYKDMTQTISDGSDLAYIIPVCQQILTINPNVVFFAAPWSPPASLKYPAGSALAGKNSGADTYLDTSGSNLTTYANDFKSHYLFFKQNGVPIRYYSLQNEPNFTLTAIRAAATELRTSQRSSRCSVRS